MREADNKSWSIFLSVVGVYVVRTSSLNDKHSCQLFRKASSLVLLSSSVSLHDQPKLFASDHLLQSQVSLQLHLASIFWEWTAWFSIFSFSGVILNPQPFFPLFFCLWSSVYSSFSFLSERFFFVHDKSALARSRNQ